MASAMQRKSNRFPYPVTIYLRAGLIGAFYELAGEAMQDVEAHYFSHSLIKNHGQEGHIVSSFITHPDWQEKYWNQYWDCDPVDSTSRIIAKVNGSALVPWQAVNDDGDCVKDRKVMCKVKSGFRFIIQHNSDTLECFSFGWKKYDANQGNRQNFTKLFHMVQGFRRAHLKLSADVFGALPAI